MAAATAGYRSRRRVTPQAFWHHFWTVVVWAAALVIIFPVFWMVLSSFKTNGTAYTYPPQFVFHPTLTQYDQLFSSFQDVTKPLLHSVFTTVASTVAVLLLAVPAAYSLSVRPVKRAKDVLFFFLTTKMLPYVAAIVPIYIVAKDLGMLDNDWTLVILYTAMNLPIAVWMIRSFLIEVPRGLLEAARIDGASLWTEIWRVIVPITAPGIAATGLICAIFAWNEFFFAQNLTFFTGVTMPVFLNSSLQSEGTFWAYLSAAATVASLPVIIAGWVAQKQLVRGLSMGALK
ncbi:MAG TPA: carbohydrate ABC transporter permease [Acidimicrobiales bacterium]|nr:carbohydrate ABC transporter permease [Acidimicrobiales bacterium]